MRKMIIELAGGPVRRLAAKLYIKNKSDDGKENPYGVPNTSRDWGGNGGVVNFVSSVYSRPNCITNK